MEARNGIAQLALVTLFIASFPASNTSAGRSTESGTMKLALEMSPGFIAVEAPALQTTCNAECINPCGLSGSQHKADSKESGGNTRSQHTDCKPFADCVGHPLCQPMLMATSDYERLLSLVEKVAEGDESAVREIRSEFGSIASVNPSRGALQVKGCEGGSFMVHLPLDPDQLTAWNATE